MMNMCTLWIAFGHDKACVQPLCGAEKWDFNQISRTD